MPYYLYELNGKTKEVHQGMNDVHEYHENGVKWNRVWCNPQAAVNTKYDPFSEKDYVRNTSNKKDTLGSLWERSAEASAKREQMAGKDDLKAKFFAKEKKRRNGKPCGAEIKERQNQVVKVKF